MLSVVNVRVRRLPNEDPVSGATLLVSGAAGSALDVVSTDSDGNARVEVPQGGAVTLLRESKSSTGTNRSISSVVDVEDGRPLLFLLGTPSDPTPANDPITLTLDAVAPPPQTASFYYSIPCWSTRLETFPKLVVDGFTGCANKDTFDAYVFALDDAGEVLAYGEALDSPFLQGQSVSLELLVNRIDFDDQLVHAGPFPAGTEKLTLFMSGYRPGDFVATPRAGMRYERAIDAPSTPMDVLLRWPRGHFEDYKFGGRIDLTSGSTRLVSGFDRFTGVLDPSFIFDPTRIALVDRTEISAADPTRPVLDFALSASGELGDALRLASGWTSSDGTTTWSVTLLPRRSGTFQLPEFPARLRDFAPPTDANWTPPSSSHFDDLGRTNYWDYLDTRVMDDTSNLDSTGLFH